jgi:hypothetical protein
MLASFVALSLTVFNPTYIKVSLDKSAAYKNIVPAMLNLAQLSASSTYDAKIDAKTLKELEAPISRAITPTFLQTTTEAVVDGTFVWLKGSASAPTFKINVATVKSALQTNLNNYLQKRVTDLPICAKGTNYGTFDPLKATCRPPIAVDQSDISQAASDVIDSIPLFQNAEISTDSLGIAKNFTPDKPIHFAPTIYGVLTKLSYVFGALVLTSGLFLVLLTKEKYKAWKTIGHTLLFAGFFLVVVGALSLFFANKFQAGFLGNASAQQLDFANTIFTPISKIITTSLADYSLYFGVGYAIIGAGCYAVAHKLKLNRIVRKQDEPEATVATAQTN